MVLSVVRNETCWFRSTIAVGKVLPVKIVLLASATLKAPAISTVFVMVSGGGESNSVSEAEQNGQGQLNVFCDEVKKS